MRILHSFLGMRFHTLIQTFATVIECKPLNARVNRVGTLSVHAGFQLRRNPREGSP